MINKFLLSLSLVGATFLAIILSLNYFLREDDDAPYDNVEVFQPDLQDNPEDFPDSQGKPKLHKKPFSGSNNQNPNKGALLSELPPFQKKEDEQPPKGREKPLVYEKMMERVIKKQIELTYGELFDELSLPEEQREKLADLLLKSTSAEAKFSHMILDPNKPVNEILQEQENLSNDLDNGLSSLLSSKEKSVTKQYRDDLPRKMQKKQLVGILNGLGLDDAAMAKSEAVVDHALNQIKYPKRLGQFTKPDIMDYREKFGNLKPGSPEFLRASLESGEENIRELLKNLQDLPEEQYQAFKVRLEMPFKMMRKNYKPE